MFVLHPSASKGGGGGLRKGGAFYFCLRDNFSSKSLNMVNSVIYQVFWGLFKSA